MSPNSKTVLGSGSGVGTEYNVVAKYGQLLTLEGNSIAGDKFLGWYKDGVKIPNPTEYLNFHDGETIEARFGKVITINIQHIGSGTGETTVKQDRQILGKSNGLKTYAIDIVDSLPIVLEHTIDDKTTLFMGWKDIDGNRININDIMLYNGIVIYAEFNIKTLGITIINKGADINSSVSQDGLLLDSKSGKDVSYVVNARIDKDLVISHNSIDSAYVFQEIKDEYGKTYTNTVGMANLKAGMILTILYKLNNATITINHVGNGSGQSSITQGANLLGSGSGQNITYIATPKMSESFIINPIADTHYELIEIQDGMGNIIQPTLAPSQFYNGMIVNIVFGLKSVPPSTGGNNGSNIYHEQIYNLGSKSGTVKIDYNMGGAIPDKLEVWYHGVMVLSTNSVSGNTSEQWQDSNGMTFTETGFTTGTGTLSFNYQPVDFDYSLKVIIKPALSSGTYWEYTVNPPI